MYSFILEKSRSTILDSFKNEDIWTGPLNGILETTKRVSNENKVLIVTYKAFPPPFCKEVFEKCVSLVSKETPSFRFYLTSDPDRCKIFFESFLNGELTGVLICSENTWQKISKSDWFPFVKKLCEHISTAEQFGVDASAFLGDLEVLVSAGYQGLSSELRKKVLKFDLSQLIFFPFLVGYCTQVGIERLDLPDFKTLIEFVLSFVECEGFSFPSFEAFERMISDETFSVVVRTPLGVEQETLNLLKYQRLITLSDYLSLKILSFASHKGALSEKAATILSKNFYVSWKRFADSLTESLDTIPWFISRLFVESYFALGIEPRISDHQISYRYWSAVPYDTEDIVRFENCIMKHVEMWRIETTRKELDKLGEKIWQTKTSPVFLGSPLFKASVADQKEFLKSVVNEIGLSVTKRWEKSDLESVRVRNGQILQKISEMLSVLHILADIQSSLVLVKNELDNTESPLFKAVSEILTAGQGEYVISQHSEKFYSFLDKFASLYGCWEDISSKAGDLAEASNAYERIRNLGFDEKGIKDFTHEWSKHLRTDIAKEQGGQRINLKKWGTLSRRYARFTQTFLSKIAEGSVTFTGIERTWKEALERLSKVHTLFIIIADSMSIVDWYSIEDRLNLEGFEKVDGFAISTIPTETPVGHASIFSGLRPGDCGVTGRTFIDKNGNAYEIATAGEEDDTPLKLGIEHKYRPEHQRKILVSDNFERKCLVFSPFKGTRLTQTLKALVSEKSEFVEDLDYKHDRSFTAITSWISGKLKSVGKKRLMNKVVIVQFPNIDKRGHKGEWDEHIYFEKMEKEMNRILQGVKDLSKREKVRIGVLLTSDHGKLLRWEVDKILYGMDEIDQEASFSNVVDIAKRKLMNYSQIHEPVLSAKYLMGWVKEDVAKVADEIVSTIEDKVGVYLPSAQYMKLFIDDFVLNLLGGKGNKNILPPNFFLVSLYQFRGPGMMQHSGLSLGELVVPFVYLEVGKP